MRGKAIAVLAVASLIAAIVWAPAVRRPALGRLAIVDPARIASPGFQIWPHRDRSYPFLVIPAEDLADWIGGVRVARAAENSQNWPGSVPDRPRKPLQTAEILPERAVKIEAPQTTAPDPDEHAMIVRVSIPPQQDESTVVKIETTRPVQFKPVRLVSPPRLVVDLEQTESRHFQQVLPAQAGVLKDVRVAQFRTAPTMVTRVVADLSTRAPFRIDSEPYGVRVQFDAPAETRPEAEQTIASQIEPVSPGRATSPALRALDGPVDLRPANFNPHPAEVADLSRPVKISLAVLRSSDPGSASQTGAQPHPPMLRNALPGVAPASTVSPMLASVEPIDSPSLPQAQQALASGQMLSRPGAARQAGIMTTPYYSQRRYTGKLISLDLRDVDIRDFFRLIHQVSGLNLAVDSDVTGRITMVMADVPWDEALDIVLKDNGLSTRLEGNVLRIAEVKTLIDESQAQAEARKAKLAAEPLVTVIRRLKYARAADQLPTPPSSGAGQGAGAPVIIPGVVSILNNLRDVIGPDGKVVADPRDNAVIVTDHQSQIPIIEAVIDKLDAKSTQVSIQVRVILANADFSRTLSSVLSGAFQSSRGHTNAAGGTGQGILGVAPTSAPLPLLPSVTQAASVGATGFGAFAITSQSANYAINAAITAAETRDQARTISRPTIVTQNNVLGEVQQGVQIPIQTSINNTVTVQYVNATLQLSVTPQVTVGNKIFLNIYVNNASVGTFSTIVGPSINTQQATTQVLVPDGGTVVFGGITVTTRARSATYIPLLGSIPIIGNLFKSSAVNDQDQELLFFVSPTILPG